MSDSAGCINAQWAKLTDEDVHHGLQHRDPLLERLSLRQANHARTPSAWSSSRDMRAGADRLLARVVQVFGGAQAHHGYLFANARASRVQLLVHDGSMEQPLLLSQANALTSIVGKSGPQGSGLASALVGLMVVFGLELLA